MLKELIHPNLKTKVNTKIAQAVCEWVTKFINSNLRKVILVTNKIKSLVPQVKKLFRPKLYPNF